MIKETEISLKSKDHPEDSRYILKVDDNQIITIIDKEFKDDQHSGNELP